MVGTKAELEARYQVPGTIRADQLDDLDVGELGAGRLVKWQMPLMWRQGRRDVSFRENEDETLAARTLAFGHEVLEKV